MESLFDLSYEQERLERIALRSFPSENGQITRDMRRNPGKYCSMRTSDPVVRKRALWVRRELAALSDLNELLESSSSESEEEEEEDSDSPGPALRGRGKSESGVFWFNLRPIHFFSLATHLPQGRPMGQPLRSISQQPWAMG